jgi:hypothetical protein
MATKKQTKKVHIDTRNMTISEGPALYTPEQLFETIDSCNNDRAVAISLDNLDSTKVNALVKETGILVGYLAEKLRRSEGQTALWRRALDVSTGLAILDQKTRGF